MLTESSMNRKQNPTRRFSGVLAIVIATTLVAPDVSAQSARAAQILEPRPITGPQTCATSSCHGGADEKSRQFVMWSQHDVHSRAYATLTTARSARMAEALKIPDATTSARCTTCHAPAQTVSPSLLAADAKVEHGVSCVSCHGTGDSWLRSHTRPDLTHGERVAAGMRDVKSLYQRANTCVACHQNIEPALLSVGRHPALYFELDGQTQSQPKHWSEPAGRSGAQAWFVGQAVALRETSRALANGQNPDSGRANPHWQALVWLVQKAAFGPVAAAAGKLPLSFSPANASAAQQVSDQVAQNSTADWTTAEIKQTLIRLANTHTEFSDQKIAALSHACRAERLVMGLDRLLAALPKADSPAGVSAQLDQLFRLVQSQPEFIPAIFARELATFAQLVGK